MGLLTNLNTDDNRAILGWSLYDWANSAFATTIMAGFFPVFFKNFWSLGADPVVSTARLGTANAVASIIVALCAPLLGAIADSGGTRKKFLMLFAATGVVMTAGLFLVAQGGWALAAALYVVACIGFSGANIFYDALLTVVAGKKKMDVVSALGFSLGYLGGGILFAVNVWMTLQPAWFGFADAAQAVRFSFLSVALWWSLFSIPVFLFVKEPVNMSRRGSDHVIKDGYLQLAQTFQEIRRLKMVFLFLAAYWLYIDGVDTIIRMAIDYGLSIGLNRDDLIVALLITQFVGFPCAIAFGYLGRMIGARRAIFIAIAIYLFVTVYAAFMTSKVEFYVMAIVIGLAQGGIQALSRSLYANMIPPQKSAQFFGFYNMLGKFAAVIGPLMISAVGLWVKHAGYGSQIASRVGILSISILFVAGGILLYFVDES